MWKAIRVGGAILSALYGLTLGALTVGDVVGGSLEGYFLGAFISLVVFGGWWLVEREQQIRRLEGIRPSARVDVQSDILEGVFLAVKNEGARGEFQAQIETVGTTDTKIRYSPSWHRYKGYWDGENREFVTIMQGQTCRIKLATFEQGSIDNGYLRVYRMTSDEMSYIDTDSYFISHAIDNPEKCSIPEVSLKVTISSDPSPKEGPTVLTLRIRAEGIVEQISP